MAIDEDKLKDAIAAFTEETDERQMSEKEPDRIVRGWCRVCGSFVVETFSMKYTRPFDMIPIGPASKDYLVRSSNGLHCEKCGIKYEFVPDDLKISDKK